MSCEGLGFAIAMEMEMEMRMRFGSISPSRSGDMTSMVMVLVHGVHVSVAQKIGALGGQVGGNLDGRDD